MSVGLLVVVLLLLPGAVARAGGAGDGSVRLTVTVNGRDGTGTRPAAVRVGDWVQKRYRLLNFGEADVYAVRVLDPGVPGGAVRCPREPLAALGETECVARFRALPGTHLDPARAEGDIPSLGRRIGATARSGYVGVAGALALAERVSVAGGAGPAGRAVRAPAGTATVTYTVTNRGNQALRSVRVEDPALRLGPGSVGCGGSAGSIALLAPGSSVRCTATVRRPPGTHRSTGLATGSDRVPTFDAGGALVPAPALTARSSAVFTIASARAPGAGGAPGTGGAAGAGAGGPGGTPPGGAAGAVAAGIPGAGGAAAGGAGTGAAPGAAGTTGTPGAGGSSGAGGAPGAAGATGAAGAAGAAGISSGASSGASSGVSSGAGTGAGTGTAAAPGVVPVPSRGAVAAPVPPPGAVPADRPPRRLAAAPDGEGFLGRVQRRTREAREFGVVGMLLLLLIPAAVAAALLGNRGK
ncbi:hypothetical protein ABTY59_08795 [Streptomyces sp. NPDC096079]|uniref:DUF7507 domain-containing protein n=1 Tax=Streptomyces sp. NPDC096079 TaxID=3155820 RepID=UPI00331CB805